MAGSEWKSSVSGLSKRTMEAGNDVEQASNESSHHSVVDGEFLVTRAEEIFEAYCANDAVDQISLGHSEYEEVRKKIYDLPTKSNGTAIDVFDSCIRLVMKSIKLDVFPRFKSSEELHQYLRMVGKYVDNEICGSEEEPSGEGRPSRGGSNVSKYAVLSEDLLSQRIDMEGIPSPPLVSEIPSASPSSITLINVVSTRCWYELFLKYLEGRYAAETLLFWRCAQIFRTSYDQLAANGKAGMRLLSEWAWSIVSTYLVRGKTHELPTPLRIGSRKQIAYGLCTPPHDMFMSVEKAAFKMLKKELFVEFRMSSLGSDESMLAALGGGEKEKKEAGCCSVS